MKINILKFEDVVLGKDGLMKGPFGSDLKKSLYVPKGDGTYKVYLQENILKNSLDKGEHYISEEYYENNMKRYTVKNDDFIVTCDGTLGEIMQLKNLKEKGIISSSLLRITLNPEIVNSDYFFYYFKIRMKDALIRQNNNSVLKHLPGLKVLKEFKLELPHINIQKSNSEILKNLDAKIELNNRINAQLEAMAKTIYDYWFVQFDFPDAKGKPYKSSGGKMVWNDELKREVPEGWEVGSILKRVEVKDGTHDSPKPSMTGFPLITSKNLKTEGLDFENANLISEKDFDDINKRSKVETGDILFSMIGNIGTIYKIEEQVINFAIKNVALFKTSKKDELKNYVYMYLKSIDMNRYLKNSISGSIQKFIGLNSLRNIPFLFNEKVIENFDSISKPIFSKQELIKQQNQHLSSLRDWLLPMLMNGQVSVCVDEDELGIAAEQNVKYGKIK